MKSNLVVYLVGSLVALGGCGDDSSSSPGEGGSAGSSAGAAGAGGASGAGGNAAGGASGSTASSGGTTGSALRVGDACASADNCPAGGSGTRVCIDQWPGGYCAVDGCAEHGHDCPEDPGLGGTATTGSKCVLAPAARCLALCASSTDCRDGYSCEPKSDAAGHGVANVCVPQSGSTSGSGMDAAAMDSGDMMDGGGMMGDGGM